MRARLCGLVAGAICTGAAAIAGAATQNQAGGAVADAPVTLEEIVVSARRRQESLQEVPLVVNAVTAESIEKLNIRGLQEITSLVPGLSLVSNANGIGSSSSMRGINHDVNVSGENGTIQYYYNDAPVGSNMVLQAMYDVGQIEVLRGPQGTLRGRATPSGSITIGLRQPNLEKLGGQAQVTAGSGSERNVQAAFNMPIVTGKFAVRLAGLSDKNEDNRVRSLVSSIEPERTTKSGRVLFRFAPVEGLNIDGMYQKLKVDYVEFDQMQSFSLLDSTAVPSSNAQNYGVVYPSDRKSVAAYPRRVSQDFGFYGWKLQYDFLGQSLIYVGSHSTSEFAPITPNDTTNFFPTLAPAQVVSTLSDSNTHEVRLQNRAPISGRFNYVAGYFRSAGGSTTVLRSPSVLRFLGQIAPGVTFPLPVAPSVNNTNIYLAPGHGTEESFYGNLSVSVGDNTEVSAGLRRIYFNSDNGGLFISCTPAQFSAGSCGTAATGTNLPTNERRSIFNASVRHHFTQNIMAYLAAGTSWRPPVRAIGDFSSSYSPLEVRHIAFGSETSKSFELGMKSDWLDNQLQVNVTAYHQSFDNYPFRKSGVGIPYININNGVPQLGNFNFISAVPVTVNGVEAELSYRPSAHFGMGSTINYSKSEVGDASLACVDALNNVTGAVGKDGIPDVAQPTLAQMQAAYGSEHLAECPSQHSSATFLPKLSGSLQSEYSHPLFGAVDGYVRGLYSWRGSTENDPSNPYDDEGAYGILNLYTGLRASNGSWEVSLYAKNLTNVTKVLSRDGAALTTGTIDVLLGAPTFTTPVGTSSATYTSRYTNVTVTPEREFGVNVRYYFGAR